MQVNEFARLERKFGLPCQWPNIFVTLELRPTKIYQQIMGHFLNSVKPKTSIDSLIFMTKFMHK